MITGPCPAVLIGFEAMLEKYLTYPVFVNNSPELLCIVMMVGSDNLCVHVAQRLHKLPNYGGGEFGQAYVILNRRF